MKMSESQLQIAVANYLSTRYPKVLFHSDFGSGVRLTAGQARVNSAQNAGRRGWPDLFVAEPYYDFEARIVGGDRWWNGLFIELKAGGTRLKKKNGEWASAHIAEQARVLMRLQEVGYCVAFAVGFDMAVDLIDAYLCGSANTEFSPDEIERELHGKDQLTF